MFEDDDPRWAARMRMTPDEMEALKQKAAQETRDAYDATTRAMAKAGEAAKGWLGAAQEAGDKFKTGFNSRMQGLLGGAAPAPGSKLRGPIDARYPGEEFQPAGKRYLADLSRPANIGAMTTCADADCSHSRIDEWPAANLGRSVSPEEVKAGIVDLLAGRPVDRGPRITFVNDQPKNPTPNQPLATPTARMIASAVLQSGVNSVNINSSTGGRHVQDPHHRSLHYDAQAVDMNRVNGERVSRANPGLNLQNAFLTQPNIAEDYGPTYLLNDKGHGLLPVRNRATIIAHQDHLHFGGNR